MTLEQLREIAIQTRVRDQREFSSGDTLDIKTGLVLVALTFLAAQSTALLGGEQTLSTSFMQALSILFLVLGGLFTFLELWPRDYVTEATPEKFEDWLVQLNQHHSGEPHAESKTLAEFLAGMTQRAKERIRRNLATNKRKSMFLMRSFVCTGIAFLLNVVTLVIRLF